ncbi:MAG: AAA family ATPase, partial [Undibacterium sp.]
RKHIEKDGALKRRFQPIHVQPPSLDETVMIIQGLRDRYEEHHGVEITEEAIVEAVKLSDRYITDRFLPDKAIDLIDETGSRAKLQTYALPSELKGMEQELKKVSREKELSISMQNFEEAVRHREEEERLRKLLDESKREWKKSQEKNKPVIGKEDVAYVVSKMTGIPLFKLEEEESNKLLRMEEFLHKRVIGQNEAISAVARAIRRSRAGLKEARKPIGSFIFMGPTGVGKTELARTLAEFLFNSEDALIRVDMSEYQEKFTSSRLFGAPPGYVGYEEGGQLTEKVRRRPYSVVLFDEIEKAHPDVFNVLLQVLDDGVLTDSLGRKIDFKNTVVIMTSNIGTKNIQKGVSLGFQSTEGEAARHKKEEVIGELRKSFSPEFLNRIDEVVIFHGRDFLKIDAGGSILPASIETVTNNQHAVFQDGKTVYKYAVTGMADVSEKIMERNNLTNADVDWLIAHQANKRIIDATSSRMNLEDEKVLINIERYGNTTSGTLPLLLFDFEKKFKKGDN